MNANFKTLLVVFGALAALVAISLLARALGAIVAASAQHSPANTVGAPRYTRGNMGTVKTSEMVV